MTTYTGDKSILLQLRNAAKVEQDELVRFKLREAANKIQAAYNIFAGSPTGDALTELNGVWAAGVRALGMATSHAPDGGNGGRLREAA